MTDKWWHELPAYRRLRDPLAQAEAARESLSRLSEARPCTWPECLASRTPDGDPYVAGRDHDGNRVWFRDWTCAVGHRYGQEEMSPEAAEEQETNEMLDSVRALLERLGEEEE